MPTDTYLQLTMFIGYLVLSITSDEKAYMYCIDAWN